ncbi:MAG: hypothetical protein Fur0012_13180 [Elusimicrobiota bacterium]
MRFPPFIHGAFLELTIHINPSRDREIFKRVIWKTYGFLVRSVKKISGDTKTAATIKAAGILPEKKEKPISFFELIFGL